MGPALCVVSSPKCLCTAPPRQWHAWRRSSSWGFPWAPKKWVCSQGKQEDFVSEGPSPSANGGAYLSLSRREAKRPPGALVVFLLFSRILGRGCAPFLRSSFLSLTPAAHLCPPGLGAWGLSTCLADDIWRQQNGLVVTDGAIAGPTLPLPTRRAPRADRPGGFGRGGGGSPSALARRRQSQGPQSGFHLPLLPHFFLRPFGVPPPAPWARTA